MATQRRYNKQDGAKVVESMFGIRLAGYIEFCRLNSFEETCEKTQGQLQREHNIYKAAVAIKTLDERRRGHKSDVMAIKALVKDPKSKTRSVEHNRLARCMPKDDDTKAAFIKLVDAADSNRTKILTDEASVKILVRAAVWYPYWVREPDSWESQSHSLHRQMYSLLRHLFAKYRIPIFMDSAWDSDNILLQEWYVHIGAGANIRTARMLPFPLTKAMAHNFLQAPKDYSILEALVHGQAISLGCDKRVSASLRGTKVMALDDEFRQSFLRFLVANPMLDTRQYGPILDYIHTMKYVECRVHHGDGTWHTEPPPQPNFSMHGRSAEALMGQVERWHRELNKSRRKGKVKWGHSPYRDFKNEEGSPNTKNHRVWSVVELTSSDELHEEGRAMKHCVSSYSESCASGRCTIWSLRRRDIGGSWRLVTLEVAHGTIVQARGIMNRSPTQQEWRIISLWADKNGISKPSYVR